MYTGFLGFRLDEFRKECWCHRAQVVRLLSARRFVQVFLKRRHVFNEFKALGCAGPVAFLLTIAAEERALLPLPMKCSCGDSFRNTSAFEIKLWGEDEFFLWLLELAFFELFES